jgi:hypothetical protein
LLEETLLHETAAAPKWILVLLWAFKSEPCYPQIEGDLEEEFHQRMSEYGIAAARTWYYREVCRNTWSLTWRWATLQAIILPALCLLFLFCARELYSPPVGVALKLLKWVFPISNTASSTVLNSASFLLRLPFSGLAGVTLGIICSLILRGHERMLRLALSGYVLGLIVLSPFIDGRWVHWPGAILVLTFPLLNLIWFSLSFSIGSMWIERRIRRPRIA